MMKTRESQLASSVLMIRPKRFQSNPQTAESNAFQTEPDLTPWKTNLMITEVMYHPADATPDEVAAGFSNSMNRLIVASPNGSSVNAPSVP